jgi:ABC-2 type transport system permease protein
MAIAGSANWMAAATLCERELVRFLRQRNRLIGALAQPLIFWVLFDAGLSGSFRPAGGPQHLTYGEYFLPGVLVLIVLFTAIFATISIIEDRNEGFLQGVLVAPVPRAMVVLGKVMGGTLLALIQALAFLAVAWLFGVRAGPGQLLAAGLFLLVVGIGLTSLGVCIAWRMDSIQGFHAIMSVVLFPMWLLSGAFFPASGAPAWLAWTIRLNPVTYMVAGLRRLLDEPSAAWTGLPSFPVCLLVTVSFAAAMFLLASRLAGRTRTKGA